MRMAVSDEELAEAAARGDRDAFGALLARHYDSVFRLAFRLTGRRDWAEDLTQDVCVALPGKLRGFRGEARFTTWLWRVVVNAVHDRRRREAVRAKAADGWGDREIDRQAEIAEEAEAIGWLRAAMAGLPEELRDTLALTLDGEMTHAEAAAVLGLSEGTVSWRLSEVRRRLRAMKQEELRA
jgi:RNA polymerase sigma-70 factor (ECF subfamily)